MSARLHEKWRKGNLARDIDWSEVEQLRALGLRDDEIAKAFGVTEEWLTEHARREAKK